MRRLPLCLCLCVILADAALAGENGNGKTLPELAPDPQVTAILEKLGDNEYAQLPPAKITGEFNDLAKGFRLDQRGPGIRNFCMKMPYAPDRKRAFYAGGNHGTPHKLNDIWEFDLAANTWVLLSPPDLNLRRGVKTNKFKTVDGVYMSEGGKIAVGGHTFSGFTYDPVSRRVLWYHKHMGPREGGYMGPYLWAFEPNTRTWEHVKTRQPWPKYDPGSAFDYVPKLGKCVWSNNRTSAAVWTYDHASKSWASLGAKGGLDDCARMSAQKVYDSRRDLLICHGGHSDYTSEYSFATRTWKKTAVCDKDHTNAPKGADKLTLFAYDSVNAVVLLCDNMGGYIWIYDPDTKKWTRTAPKNSQPDRRCTRGIHKGNKFLPLGFFDSARNALVTNDGGKVTWVYRYKRAGK